MNKPWTGRSTVLPFCGLILALASSRTDALIFSQLGKTYDHMHNVIPWTNAWNAGHAIGTLHGANGTAIAPYWFLTAAHLEMTKPRVFDSADGSFLIKEFVALPEGDMMLCRVDRPFRTYSELLKEPLRPGQVVRMYGQSSSHWAREPVIDSNDVVKGWLFGEAKRESIHLRQGLARLETATRNSFSWYFSASDPEVGTNCAAVMHMDSGGGVFFGKALAGILIRGTLSRGHRATTAVKFGDCSYGYIFDTTNLLECFSNTPQYPFQRSITPGDAVGGNLDAIYKIIAPPIRINAGGPDTNGWAGWRGGYRTMAFSAEVAPTQSTNATPESIYESAVFVQGTNMLTFNATNLLTTDLYTARLHFGGFPFLAPGEATQDVYVNGIIRARQFDPIAVGREGGGRAILEIRNIAPVPGSLAAITLIGSGTKRIAYLSGLEVTLQRKI